LADFSQELKRFARGLGADLVGFTPAERLDAVLKPGHRACDQFPGVQSVIAICLHIPDASMDVMEQGISNYSYNMFGYAFLNRELDHIAYRVTRYLEDRGFSALPIPARGEHYWDQDRNYGPISFRHAAVAAGLGYFGWQGLLITPEFGTRQRIIAILTDARLEADQVQQQQLEHCRRCLLCVKNCPAGAVKEDQEWQIEIGGEQFTYGVVDCEACEWMSEGYSSKLWAEAPFHPKIDVPHPEKMDARTMYDLKWHYRDPALNISEHAEGNFGASLCGRCQITCPLGKAAAKKRRRQ
jgi:epoxyqueuosine reductase